MNYINDKKASPLVIMAIVVVLLMLIAGVVAVLNMKCVFGHAYTNGACERCSIVCVHEKVEADGLCAECGLTVKVENEVPLAVDTATGEALVSGQAYAMTNMAFTRATAMSSTEVEGITIKANVLPEYASNKAVDWHISFVNANSTWATGKNVSDYVTLSPVSDGSLECVVTCLAPFGEQIKITVTSRDNSGAYSSITVDYLQTVTGVQIKIGDIVLTPGDNYIEGFVIENGKTGPGGEVKVEYVGGDTYTLTLEELSYGLFFLDYDLEGSGKEDDFAYTFEAYDSSTKQYEIVSSSWYMNESIAENRNDYSTVTFDVDWFWSRFGVYCDVPVLGANNGWDENSEVYDKTISAIRDLKDVPTDVLVKMFESAMENGTDVILQFNVPVAHVGGGLQGSYYFTVHVGSIADIGVESVEIENDNLTFGGE